MTADWVYSLKDKRTIVKGLIEKVRHKFNVSIAETELNDVHRSICISFACVTNATEHANSIIQHVLNFIESHTEAVVNDVIIEIL
jgi:uncharacterized protein YlxP (DUF503 family)